jgi:release factor glutamine methyltransferase
MRFKTTKSGDVWPRERLPEATFSLTVGEAVKRATGMLSEAGCDTPRLDAELLAAAALGVERAQLVLDRDQELDPDLLGVLGGMVARRCGREPIAYILGRKPFRRIELLVDSRVLIPRPETELLVEVGLSLRSGVRVVDVGTGSGAVALALKDERPDLEVMGTDISEEALQVARENARRLGLAVTFVHSDLLEGIEGPFDAVLGNLPYVEDGASLEPEITRYEPGDALFAGPDGLDVIKRLAAAVSGVPLVALEVGAGQSRAVGDLLRANGFRSVEALADLAGHERVVVARR